MGEQGAGAAPDTGGGGRLALGPVAWTGIAFTAVFLAWVVLGDRQATHRELISDLAPLPMGLCVALAAWWAGGHPDVHPSSRRAWHVMGAAFGLWWLGDVIWFFYEAVLDRQPFPSAADGGYLAFYPVMAVGLLSLATRRSTRSEQLKGGLDAVTVLLSGGMVVWYLVVGPTVQGEPEGLATVLNVAYPVGDLLLVFGLAVTLLRRHGRDTAVWLLLAGVGSFVVADVAYARLSLSESYQGGDWPDAAWMVAQCLFLVAASVQRRRPARPDVEAITVGPSNISRLPYGAVVLGYGLLLVVGQNTASYPLNGLVFGAAAMTAVVVVRQLGVMAENARLLALLHRQADTDGLTEVANRRSLLDVGERLLDRSRAVQRPLSVLMIDVDHFKRVNDTYGHAAGDDVLVAVSRCAKAHVRETDVVGRYGGDELAVVMPDCSQALALEVADRIGTAVANLPIATPTGDARVTLSIGVAEAPAAGDLAEAFAVADRGLYLAKEAGRACTRAG